MDKDVNKDQLEDLEPDDADSIKGGSPVDSLIEKTPGRAKGAVDRRTQAVRDAL